MLGLMKDESGITALETAIILIAFVVVAAVFAFTVLQAGTFSTERGREVIYGSIEQVSSSMEVVGAVKAQKTDADTEVVTLTFELQTVAGGSGINITDTSSSENIVVISYGDSDEYNEKLTWTMDWIIRDDSDDLLERNEIGQIIINLPDNGVGLGAGEQFMLEIKPPQGSVVPILRTTPASLDNVMFLNH